MWKELVLTIHNMCWVGGGLAPLVARTRIHRPLRSTLPLSSYSFWSGFEGIFLLSPSFFLAGTAVRVGDFSLTHRFRDCNLPPWTSLILAKSFGNGKMSHKRAETCCKSWSSLASIQCSSYYQRTWRLNAISSPCGISKMEMGLQKQSLSNYIESWRLPWRIWKIWVPPPEFWSCRSGMEHETIHWSKSPGQLDKVELETVFWYPPFQNILPHSP